MRHQIATFDAQPSSEGGIIVLVTGALLVRCLQSPTFMNHSNADSSEQVDEEQKPMSYTQCFKLQPDGAGSFFVLNDVFRLIYAA